MTKKKLSFVLLFTILCATMSLAHVSLNAPKGGEQYKPGVEITIKWSIAVDHGDNNWDLFYSLDGGAIWDEIALDLNKSILEYKWKLPMTETTMAKVKVVQDNDEHNDYDDKSTNFIISNSGTPIDPEPEAITSLDDVDLHSHEVIQFSNFPNPFHASTTIQFSLSQNSQVRLAVYNINGKIISELLNGQMGKGSYDIPWKNDGFSKGIYLCNLMVGDQKFTRKIISKP